MNNFYIYIYLDTRESGKYCYENFSFLYKPFYIGKGKNGRYLIKNGRKKDFIEIINEIEENGLEPIITKLYENLSEEESFELETKLIKEIGRIDLGTGYLINKTSGGQGNSGYNHTEKTKEIISKKQRKNFQNIKHEFEKRGYILLTKENEYKNAFSKLEYTCPKGHEGFISWNHFQRGCGCPIEGREHGNKKQKKDFKIIQKEFEKRKYILLTKENEYKNAFTKLRYICPRGHEGYISWHNFQQEQCCSICWNEKRRKNFLEIKKEFERRDYILLTEENDYKNAKQKLRYICPEGHEGYMSWDHFQQGQNCRCIYRRKNEK